MVIVASARRARGTRETILEVNAVNRFGPATCGEHRQTVFQGQIGNHLLERRSLTPQILDLVRSRSTGRVTGQALLASLQKVFRPAIVQVLCDPFAAAQLGDTVLAAQAFQHDADLLFGRILLARRPSDVLDDLLSRFLRRSSLLSHLRSCERYDEPETLPCSICQFCLTSADGGQERRHWSSRNHRRLSLSSAVP